MSAQIIKLVFLAISQCEGVLFCIWGWYVVSYIPYIKRYHCHCKIFDLQHTHLDAFFASVI